MTHNPITQEILGIRHQLAAQQANDIHRIGGETVNANTDSTPSAG